MRRAKSTAKTHLLMLIATCRALYDMCRLLKPASGMRHGWNGADL